MLRTKRLVGCLLLLLLQTGGVKANNGAQALAPGNGIWIDSNTPISGNEVQIVSNLQARAIKHVFIFTINDTSSQYASYAKFLQVAHSSNMTVHAICAEASTVTSGNALSPLLLSNVIQQIIIYNNSTNTASQFDGVQVDIEGVTGLALLTLLQGVTVPSALYFSADVQPNEFAPEASTSPYYIESYYSNMLATSSLDLLVPMIYIMDDLGYSNGNLTYGFGITGSDSISYKTSEILARLPSYGKGYGMMTGLSAYDYEAAVTMGGGANWTPTGGWWGSQMAFSGGSYSVPYMAAHWPLVSATYQPITGISSYRFNYEGTNWWDVNEMTPIGEGLSIAAANSAGTNDVRYVGAAAFKYFTIFDSTSERQQGVAMNDTNYPSPQLSLQVLSVVGNLARLRVSLTNGNPTEQILGDSASAGVHLQLPAGASFVSAAPGSFHTALAFDTSGNQLTNISGTKVLELRRCFFENLASQGVQSGDIYVTALVPFTLQYRAWLTSKDSIYNNNGATAPYITRSPNDLPYNDPSKFMTYATFTTNVSVVPSCAYVAAVGADSPVFYYRFSETNVVSLPNPFTVTNLGTLGPTGNGLAATTNNSISTSILGGLPGALASSTDTAFGFPGTDTNRISVPYRPEWNINAPFSVELWLKGGTNFSCPASSVQYDQAGWLIYQGDSSQASGNGWYFRVYNSSGTRVNAQVNMTVSPTAWYHIVGVYDGANSVLYTNGVLAATTALGGAYAPNTSPTNSLTFGARSNGGSRAYGGLLDEPAFYTNALSASQVAAHYAAATTNAAGYAAQILAQHPAGYWPFNEMLNPPVAANSGGSYTAGNGAYLNWSTTVPDLQAPACPGLEPTNSVLQLFGTNGQVLLPPLNLNTNTVTFECWLKRNGSQSSFAGLVMHRDADTSGACGLGFHGSSNHLGYWWNDAVNTYNWDSGLLPPDGQWTYAALTISSIQAVINMCDGTTWSAATNPVSHAVQPFAGLTRIGSDGGLSGHWFNGWLDEVAIYNAALTQTQLRTHALSAFGNTNQPLFTQLPASQTVQFGTTVSFNAAAVGVPAILCQWQKNGANLAGATNLALMLPSVDYTNAGQYSLAATNNYGGVLSPAATLTVMPPSWVTNLTYRILASGSGSGQNLGLIWPTGTLYSATNVAGPWTVVSGAALPYYQVPINPATPSLFFKAK